MATRPKIGEIWTAHEGTKTRPVLIINEGMGIEIDVNILRITSQKPRHEFDVPLKNWKEAGLFKESVVRVTKITTVHYLQCKDLIGQISKEDMLEVKKALSKYYIESLDSYGEKGE